MMFQSNGTTVSVIRTGTNNMDRYLNLFTTAIVTGYESGKDEYFFQTGLHILLSLN